MLDELQLRNLSALTTRAYIGAVERFAQYFQKSPQQLGVEQVREYLLHLIRDRKAPPNTVMVNRSALRFLYVCTLKQSWFEENIPQPKRPLTLPDVLSAEEVTLMLDSTRNLKHWTIMATLYATALRCGELQHLKVGDVDLSGHLQSGHRGTREIRPMELLKSNDAPSHSFSCCDRRDIHKPFWRKSDKSQGFGDRVPKGFRFLGAFYAIAK
jgi:site-specific recombinase XerD